MLLHVQHVGTHMLLATIVLVHIHVCVGAHRGADILMLLESVVLGLACVTENHSANILFAGTTV